MTTFTVNIPSRVEEPRGSLWFSELVGALVTYLQKRAADRNLASLAHTSARERAKYRAKNVAQARAMAQEMGRQDPRAAADLMAAIDRYETEA